ncbi:MAG: hypothetical protein OXU78_01250, partial [Deltaproteobacteria bacterium]|nr:hypothetical protein [Deltaproteobacteria bacterium]
MRGFTRRRPWPGRGRGMDESWLQRALEALPVEADSAQRRTLPGVADSFALIASAAHTGAPGSAHSDAPGVAAGEAGAEGARWIVAVSDRSGGDAVLAALAAAAAEPSAPAMLAACAPHWDGASRWLLSRLGAPAVGEAGSAASASTGAASAAPPAAPSIWPLCLPGERGAVLARAEAAPPAALPPERLAEGLAAPAREVFGRAALAMRGLAAKHGGAVRSVSAPSAALELVLLAQPVAALRAEAESGEAVLELAGRRISLRGGEGLLAEPLDRLEAQLRKRAGDRRARGGEDGARARLLAALAEAAELRHLRRWPVAGEGAALDGLGLLPDGQIALLAARARLGLPELAAILRAAWAAAPSLPLLLRDAPAPLRLDSRPALLLASPAADDAARAALRWLAPVSLWQAGSLDGPLTPLALPGAGALGETAPARGDAASARGEVRGESAGAPRPRRRRGRGRRGGARPESEGTGAPGALGRAPEGAGSRGAP